MDFGFKRCQIQLIQLCQHFRKLLDIGNERTQTAFSEIGKRFHGGIQIGDRAVISGTVLNSLIDLINLICNIGGDSEITSFVKCAQTSGKVLQLLTCATHSVNRITDFL